MFEVVKVIKSKPKKVIEEARSDSTNRTNQSVHETEAATLKKGRILAGHKTSEKKTAAQDTNSSSQTKQDHLNHSKDPAIMGKEDIIIDRSKPPSKPPRKLDPLSQKQHTSSSSPGIANASERVMEADILSKDSSLGPKTEQTVSEAHQQEESTDGIASADSKDNSDEGERSQNIVDQKDRQQNPRDARRLARERVLRKIKEDKERVEAQEKAKLEQIAIRNESSAAKAKRLQEKTLERVALLKENAKRKQIEAEETANEVEMRRIESQQQASTEEYAQKMIRMRQQASKRLHAAERKIERLAYQAEIELQQKLREKKQQVDVSTTFVPPPKPRKVPSQYQVPAHRQQQSLQSQNHHNNLQINHASYLGQQPGATTQHNQHLFQAQHHYEHHHQHQSPSFEDAQDYNEDQSIYHGIIEHDGGNDEDALQREQDAYINGDSEYLQQQDQLTSNFHPHYHSNDNSTRPHTVGSIEPLDNRHHSNDSMRPVSTASASASENNHYFYNKDGMETTNANMYRQGSSDSTSQFYKPQPPSKPPQQQLQPGHHNKKSLAFSPHSTTSHRHHNLSSKASLFSTESAVSKHSGHYNAKHEDTYDKNETFAQRERRRQELEQIVGTWLSGEDDTTFAAKQPLFSPSPPRKKSPCVVANDNVRSPLRFSNQANDDDSSSWGSDDNQPSQPRNVAVSFAIKQPSVSMTKSSYHDDNQDENQVDDSASDVSELTDHEHHASAANSSKQKYSQPPSNERVLPTASDVQNRTHSCVTSINKSKSVENRQLPRDIYKSHYSQKQSDMQTSNQCGQTSISNRSKKTKQFRPLPPIPIAPYNNVSVSY
jgi:hypothetical protein